MTETLAAAPVPADRSPLIASLACFTFWGLLPILFIWADRLGAGAMEIVAWRIIWAVPWAIALVLVAGQGGHLRRLPRATLAALLLSSALIAVNWSIYVWAVCSGRTISASLGYYLNPLLNMAAGAVLFKEKISRPGRIAIALAAIGVALQGWALGEFPWVSLGLAFTFCGYGIVRKAAVVEAQTGLLVECLVLVIPAAVYAFSLHQSGHGVFGTGAMVSLVLALGGPSTVIPLALFAFAARRMPLTAIGFLQFIAPTLQFMVGVETGETMTPLRAFSFLFIWAGVLVFVVGAWQKFRAQRRA